MIDGQNFFNKPAKINLRTYDNRKISTGQGDDYTTSYQLDYNDFNKHSIMTTIDLSEQQALDADPKEIQQIYFPWNLNRALNVNKNTTLLSFIEVAKKHFRFFTRICESNVILYYFSMISI